MIADGTMAPWYGVAKIIPLTFDKMKAKMNFLVFDGVVVGVVIGIQEFKRLSAQFELRDLHVDFVIAKKSVRVGLDP